MLELVQASRQHRRAGDEHDGQGRLHDQQRRAREGRMIAGAAARPAQRFDRIGARRQPGGRRAEDDAGQQRQAERERQHEQRRQRADGKELRSCGTPARAAGARRPSRPPVRRCRRRCASRTLSIERLRDDLPTRGADGQPHGGLCPRRATARASSRFATLAQAISSTRPQTAKQNLQAAAVLLLHHADAGAGRHDGDRLLRQHADDVGHPVGGICRSRAASTGAGRR